MKIHIVVLRKKTESRREQVGENTQVAHLIIKAGFDSLVTAVVGVSFMEGIAAKQQHSAIAR